MTRAAPGGSAGSAAASPTERRPDRPGTRGVGTAAAAEAPAPSLQVAAGPLGPGGRARGRARGGARPRDGLRPQYPRLAERRDLLPGLGRVQLAAPDHQRVAGLRGPPARPLRPDRRRRRHRPEPRVQSPRRRPRPPGPRGAGQQQQCGLCSLRRDHLQGPEAPLLQQRGGRDPDQLRQRQGKRQAPARRGPPAPSGRGSYGQGAPAELGGRDAAGLERLSLEGVYFPFEGGDEGPGNVSRKSPGGSWEPVLGDWVEKRAQWEVVVLAGFSLSEEGVGSVNCGRGAYH